MNRTWASERAINAIRTPHTLFKLGAVAALAVAIAPMRAPAQNAVQRAALARMSHAHASATSGSGVAASAVSLNRPNGLAFDASGNLYIADTDNNIIREVSIVGLISTVVGDGEQGFGGDGGSALDAQLDTPTGVALDASGNLFIADSHNNRIREVTGGIISTIAGTGIAGFSGDGASALTAKLDLPTAIAVDSKGNIYFADTNNNRIREITGTTINTVAGDGEQTYSGEGGLATAAGLDSPTGVAVDAAFNLYISDTRNQRVRMVAAGSRNITTIAGNGVKGFTADGSALSAALSSPSGLAADSSGQIYVADSDNNRIRTIISGNITTIAGDGTEGFSGDSGASTSASLNTPHAVITGPGGIFLSDTDNNRVREVSGSTINTVGGQGSQGAESLVIGGPPSASYGSGELTAAFSNGGLVGTGAVTFYDGEGASPAVIGQASLTGNLATVSTRTLSAGIHYIIASYGGDSKNLAVSSGVYVFVVTQLQLSAVSNSVNLLYGQTIPALTGTLTGVLAQDSGNVSAVFSTTATSASVPGSYPIAVNLTGAAAGNYSVVQGAGSGSVSISQAPTATALLASSVSPILGTSVTLTATVTSATGVTPAGSVNFLNGSAQLNTTPIGLNGGIATLNLTTLPTGSFSLTAVYSGNADFIASSSSPLAVTGLSPDFNIAVSPATQTVLPARSVNYTISLTPTNPTFVYPTSLSVSGLPSGVTATFTPSSIASGAGVSMITLSVSASSLAHLRDINRQFSGPPLSDALALLLLPLLFGKRARKATERLSRSGRLLLALLSLTVVGVVSGCGGGDDLFGHSTKSYTLTVTAVSGPQTHTTDVILTVQ